MNGMTASLNCRKHKRHPREFTIAGANGVAQNFIVRSNPSDRGRRKTLAADVASTTKIQGEQ
jgi:hypothetical protein